MQELAVVVIPVLLMIFAMGMDHLEDFFIGSRSRQRSDTVTARASRGAPAPERQAAESADDPTSVKRIIHAAPVVDTASVDTDADTASAKPASNASPDPAAARAS